MKLIQTPEQYRARMRPALCLDLDGTVRHSKSGDFIKDDRDIALFDGVEARIWEYRERGFLIFGISNQAGVAHGFKTPALVDLELDATFALFKRNPFHIVKVAYHDGAGKVEPYCHRSLLRKPDYGMLALCEVEAFDAGHIVDWERSIFVGDRPEDEQCAQAAGVSFQWAHAFFSRPKEQ